MSKLKTERQILGRSLKFGGFKIGNTPKRAAQLFHEVNQDFFQPVGAPVADLAILLQPELGIPLRAGIGALNSVDKLAVKFAGKSTAPQPKRPYALMP